MKVKYSRSRLNAKQTSFTSPMGARRQCGEQEHAQYRTNHEVTSGWSCRCPENVSILSSLLCQQDAPLIGVLWNLTSVLISRGEKILSWRSMAVEWCSIFANPIAFKRMHPSMVLELSLLTTGLPALGRLSPQTPPTHAYFHLTFVLLVALSTRHFDQISISCVELLIIPDSYLRPPLGCSLDKQTCLRRNW